jgi:hypothetical protein
MNSYRFLLRLQDRHLVLPLLVVGLAVLAFWAWVPAVTPGEACQMRNNAAWISVDWTSQPVDEAAVAELAQSASQRQLRNLFPFTSYMKEDGAWSQSYAYAAEFVSAYKRHNPDTKLLAWIGVPIVNERPFGIHGWVNLADQVERQRIVDFAITLVNEAGFDGVHLNVEHVDNGDPDFLLLLEEVREASGPDKMLSVAANDWLPASLNSLPEIGGYKWSDTYLRAVASHVDQIAMMTYDSLLPHAALYRLWLREQVGGIQRSLDGSEVEVLIGLSVSREETRTHSPQAENMGAGLAGACAGFARLPASGHNIEGVAIYAAWEADESDWRIWETWQKNLRIEE